MRKSIAFVCAVAVALMVMFIWLKCRTIVVATDAPPQGEVSAPTNDVPPPQVVEVTIPAVQTEGVVSNTDGSVIARGSASFTVAPVSTSPPPRMISEAEARRLSSPPQK
ncbi:MAG TPA: hypothetical protein VJI33_04600 [Candidatus Paceibacterota bacterium]